MPVSVLSKLKNVEIEDRSFTDTDSGELREYKRLVLTVEFDGEEEKLDAQLVKAEGRSGYRILQTADDVN